MSDLYEEIKQDKIKDLILTIITFLFIIAAVGMISVGLYTWYQVHQRNKTEAQGQAMHEAISKLGQNMAQGDVQTSIEKLKKIAQQSGSYPGLARFYLAKLYESQGKTSAAIFEYKQVVDDEKIDLAIRNLGALKLISAKLMDGKTNVTEARKELDKYFPQTSSNEQAPFYHAATLLRASLALHDKAYPAAENAMHELIASRQKYNETIELADKIMQEYVDFKAQQEQPPKHNNPAAEQSSGK